MVLEYLKIQSKAWASILFLASPPRIRYLSLWMHQDLSPLWSGISATPNMKSRPAIKFPTPYEWWSNDPLLRRLYKVHQIPSLSGKKIRQMPGVCPGRGVFKLRFDWYITLFILINVLTSISERFCLNFEQINIPDHSSATGLNTWQYSSEGGIRRKLVRIESNANFPSRFQFFNFFCRQGTHYHLLCPFQHLKQKLFKCIQARTF